MNSAAVIGRQLRQQQQQTTTAGRQTGPLVPPSPHKGRPRTPSHHPHHQQQHHHQHHQQLPSPPAAGQQQTQQQQQQKSSTTTQQSPPKPKDQKQQQAQQQQQQQKPKGALDKMKSCISFRCIWLCFKALSGGVLLIAIGVGMTVFGFYADSFAVHEQFDESVNRTVLVTNEQIRMHIHNLTYVGPVFMGLGGMLIVAACVLTSDGQEDDPVAPRNRRSSDVEGTEHLIAASEAAGKAERCNGPLSPFLGLATDSPIRDKGGGTAAARQQQQEVVTTVAEVVLPNGPRRPQLPSLPVVTRNDAVSPAEMQPLNQSAAGSCTSSPQALPRVTVRQGGKRRGVGRRGNSGNGHFLSPLFDDFVPSPQDIQIPDPDGCTPDAGCALEMDVFNRTTTTTTKCPPLRLQLEPRYLASIESDGLSDSDTEESEFTLSGGSSSVGRLKGRFCSPCDVEEPLLGRCSPSSSPEYPMEPLLKRDRTTAGLRRFQLMRQAPHSRTLFDGPPSEGGSR